MLAFHEISLADLILHEMTHNTIFRKGDTEFKTEQLPEINNAWLQANRRYNLDLALFARVFDATDEDFKTSIAVFEQAANADDAKQFLRDWLATNAPESANP